MKTFRTRPVEVNALQWTNDNLTEMIEFTENNFRVRSQMEQIAETALRARDDREPVANVQVYDKLHTTWINVLNGQWIVRGVKGEYYPCDNETFFWKYEEIEQS